MCFHEDENPVFPTLPRVDPVSLRVFHTFFKTVRLHRQLMFRLMSEIEAYPGQAACLLIISNHDGITQRDLARKLHVASSTVTVMLQKMEGANLVVRKVDEHDQRLTRLYLTDRGRMLQDEMNSVLAEFINSTFGTMSLGDQKDLDRLLSMLCVAVSEEL